MRTPQRLLAVDQTGYVFPTGTFCDTIILTHTVRAPEGIPPTGSLVGIDHAFEATAVYSDTGQLAQPIPGQAFTITVDYAQQDLGTAIEDTMALSRELSLPDLAATLSTPIQRIDLLRKMWYIPAPQKSGTLTYLSNEE